MALELSKERVLVLIHQGGVRCVQGLYDAAGFVIGAISLVFAQFWQAIYT